MKSNVEVTAIYYHEKAGAPFFKSLTNPFLISSLSFLADIALFARYRLLLHRLVEYNSSGGGKSSSLSSAVKGGATTHNY